jgi:hypothetical protein
MQDAAAGGKAASGRRSMASMFGRLYSDGLLFWQDGRLRRHGAKLVNVPLLCARCVGVAGDALAFASARFLRAHL